MLHYWLLICQSKPLPLGAGPAAEDSDQSESEDEEKEEDGRHPADTALIEVCSSYSLSVLENLININI